MHLQHDAALLKEPDCHDTVRLSSGCESSESGLEVAVTPSHVLGVLLGVLRNNLHLAELWCQIKALEMLSLSLLKGKLPYQL